ncbi:MAG: glycosyltransferase [Bacteroidia bacterium]|nr:glycosyltransferase [Bacteroidia bacterium]
MIVVSITILALYSILIIAFIIGFDRVEFFKLSSFDHKTRFSIIIPFRNEAQNLNPLLTSLSKLNYPKSLFEIILVDDDSEDDSVKLISTFIENARIDIKIVKNIRMSDAPKKDAIETAIGQAKFDWIVTTDADCLVPESWLQTIDAFIQEYDPKCIVAPVNYKIEESFLDKFQLLDFLSLQASTIGGFGINKPFLCNGANLCYEKQAFFDVKGFTGNTHIASGDDIFLFEKLLDAYPGNIHFLRSDEAIVTTKPQSTLRKLLSQRIRWAAKSTAFTNNFAKFVGITVLSMNILLVITLLLAIFNMFNWQLFLLMVFVKLSLDFVLIKKVFNFYKQPISFFHYIASGLLYPFFSMFVAIVSIQSNYSWKGRTFKK